MQLRSVVLLLTVLAIAALAALNWPALAEPSAVSLGLTTIEAPLGLIMLALTALLGVFFVAYVLSLQGSVLMETRRHTKELQAQRELADRAEASRFTELRAFLEAQHQQAHAAVLHRLDALEAHLAARAQETDNTTAAYVGQLEQQLRDRESRATVITPIV
ncbi:LapA family protein [Acidovorax sp.]|uniref:LapA family protein n=1 Tax=Acidovorax sp. TaxID=1872122 RepID=UPI00391A16ED